MIHAASLLIIASASIVASDTNPAAGYGSGEASSQYAPVDPPVAGYVQGDVLPPTFVPEPLSVQVEENPIYVAEEPATPPPDFEAPKDPYVTHKVNHECHETAQPNSAKYMSYVCSSLYASALKWSNNNCKGYYAAATPDNKNSQYQAKLCTYWTERSVLKVVTSCFIEAHLRTEFIEKHGKEGPGVWFCKYKEFVNQVMDCYGGSLKYYPLGTELNAIESSVAGLIGAHSEDDMPPFQLTGASVAMCAYYNKDQVYHRGDY